MNTPQKGKFRYIVFKEGHTWYASCLEFNIVITGDDARIALINLFDTATGYIESVRKIKGGRYKALNQTPDAEYEKLWDIATGKKKIKSPYFIETFGYSTISK